MQVAIEVWEQGDEVYRGEGKTLSEALQSVRTVLQARRAQLTSKQLPVKRLLEVVELEIGP